MYILLVEDNDANADMLARRLRRRGHEVCRAVDGFHALEVARAEAGLSVVLMDLSLPRMNGWEATRRLKADPSLRHLPVIALTAHALSGDRREALAVGCDEYESKPIDFEQLLAKMERLAATTQ